MNETKLHLLIPVFSIFSSALQCYSCTYCGDPFDHRQADEVNCTGTCGKTKRDDCTYIEDLTRVVI